MSEEKVASHKPGHGGHEEEHEEHVNHEAWVIPYADMLTLLMALFLMLWATSSVDEKKFAALAESLRDAFGGGTGAHAQVAVAPGSPGILDGQQSGVENGDRDSAVKIPDRAEMIQAAMMDSALQQSAADKALKRERERAEAKLKETIAFDDVQKQITDHAADNGMLEALKFERQERGLVVTIVTDNVLFDPGSASLKPIGQDVLRTVAEALLKVPNQVMVEGHTDNTPIATSQYPSNWELSSHRGTSVLRYIVDRVGFRQDRIASTGYGETRPVASNDTAEGRSANRRVEIVVLSSAPAS